MGPLTRVTPVTRRRKAFAAERRINATLERAMLRFSDRHSRETVGSTGHKLASAAGQLQFFAVDERVHTNFPDPWCRGGFLDSLRFLRLFHCEIADGG